MSFRIFSIGVDDTILLLSELSTGREIRICEGQIPKGTGVAGVTYDEETRRFEVKLVHHNWPDTIPEGEIITISYAVRLGQSGTHGDWGMPVTIGARGA